MTPAPRWMRRRPPDCRKVARVLQAYLDGELPEDDHEVVADHLRHCERCGIEAYVYREVKRSLEALATRPDHRAVTRLRAYAADLHQGDGASPDQP